MNKFVPRLARTLVVCTLSVHAMRSAPAYAVLRWSPPTLSCPETIYLGTGRTSNQLDNTKDYILKLPPVQKVGSTTIVGGHNIVIMGGSITVPVGDPVQRAIYLKNIVGTVHIEGVNIDNPAAAEFDGIAIASPDATVQLENCRITGLVGTYTTWHSDLVQPWGGVKHLYVDYFTGTSGYQGFQIPLDLGPIISTELRNVNLRHEIPAGALGSELLWLTTGTSGGNTYPITLANVYITPRPGHGSVGQGSVYPSTSQPNGFEAIQDGTKVTWPNLPTITGYVRQGEPTTGDYVPDGVAGLNYVSPGYR